MGPSSHTLIWWEPILELMSTDAYHLDHSHPPLPPIAPAIAAVAPPPTAMLQQPRVPPTGQRQAVEVHIKWREVLDYKRELLRCLSLATGWGVDKLDADMQRPLYMRPQVWLPKRQCFQKTLSGMRRPLHMLPQVLFRCRMKKRMQNNACGRPPAHPPTHTTNR